MSHQTTKVECSKNAKRIYIFHGYALHPSLREEGQDAWRRKWRTSGTTASRKDHSKFFMDKTEQRATSRSALNSKGSFQCFGFGYNGLTQLSAHKSVSEDKEPPQPSSSAVLSPVPLNVDCVSSIAASWSCSFYLKGWCYSKLCF